MICSVAGSSVTARPLPASWCGNCWPTTLTLVCGKLKPRIERLAAVPVLDGLAIMEVTLLELRALLARAKGDQTAYRDYRHRYRDMATEVGFEGT
jgi:hypothetical protein